MRNKKWIALGITLLLLCLIFYKIDWAELLTTLKNFKIKYLLFISPLYIFTLYLRGIRWKALLLNDKKYSSNELMQVFTVGSMLNTFLPARAGDLYRACYLGEIKSEQKMKVFGSVIFERIMDGIAVLLLLLAVLFMYRESKLLLNTAYIAGSLFLVGLIFVFWMFKFNKTDIIFTSIENFFRKNNFIKIADLSAKIKNYTNSFISGFEVFSSWKGMSGAFILSLIIWIIEAVIAYLVMISLNMHLGMTAALLVTSLTSLSTVIPSTSVFLGPYQYAYIIALSLCSSNITKSTALACATVHQTILILILTILGTIWLLKFNITFPKLKKEN